jgi:hypothetical protein
MSSSVSIVPSVLLPVEPTGLLLAYRYCVVVLVLSPFPSS